MTRILIVLPFLLAACAASGALSPEKQAEAEAATLAVLCQPKGVYIGDAFNAHWNETQRALYRASIDAQRILKCPDPLALGYGSPPAD